RSRPRALIQTRPLGAYESFPRKATDRLTDHTPNVLTDDRGKVVKIRQRAAAMAPRVNGGAPSDVTSVHDEEALIDRAQRGERSAFAELYDRHVDAVYRYIAFRVRDEDEAEDVTSEVFIKAMGALPRYEPRQPFLAWLYRIARNAVIDRLRLSSRRTETALTDPAAQAIQNSDLSRLDPARRARIRRRLLLAPTPEPERMGVHRPWRRVALAAVVLLAISLALGGAASASLPGDAAFPLKIEVERLQL